VIKNAVLARQLREENAEFKNQLAEKASVTGESVPLKALRQQVKLMAPTNGRVLIYGDQVRARSGLHGPSMQRVCGRSVCL